MVKGNRKAKSAARQAQSLTGDRYARSRRMTMSQKCAVCNNITTNPSGRCYLHEGAAATSTDSATFSASPQSVIQAPPEIAEVYGERDMMDVIRDYEEEHGVEMPESEMLKVVFHNRHRLDDESAENILMQVVEWNGVRDGNPVNAMVDFARGEARWSDSGDEVSFISPLDGSVMTTIKKTDDSVEESDNPPYIRGAVDYQRVLEARTKWPEFGINTDPKTLDEVLHMPEYADLWKQIATPHSDQDDLSYEGRESLIAEKHGLDFMDLHEAAFDHGMELNRASRSGGRGGRKYA